MRPGDSATYGHVGLHAFDDEGALRITFTCQGYDEYVNNHGNNVRRWRFEVIASNSERDVARTHLVALALDKTNAQYVSDLPYEMLARRTNAQHSWVGGKTIGQYSSPSPINITAAVLRILEEIDLVFRPEDRIESEEVEV